MAADPTVAPARPWAWALLACVGWVVAFTLAFFLVAGAETVGLLPPDPAGLRIDLALVIAMHGAFAMNAAQVAAWLTLGTWPSPAPRRLGLPALGVGLAVLAELALHEWAEARYGYYEFELIGWTALLSVALVASATAAFGVAVAPRGAVAAPLVALCLAAAGVLLIVGSNIPGLGDGLGSGSWPLAVLVGLSAAYVVGAVGLGVRRLRAR